MLQANMLEAKTDLSKLVKMLEEGREDVVYIARNNVPDDFEAWDEEVESLFEVAR